MAAKTDIKQDIKQSKPFEHTSAEAIVALLRTADEIKRRLSEVTSQLDITPQQYNVLRILRGAGKEGLPTLEIGKRMIERSPGITRLIDRMEKKRLVQRKRSGSDRRCIPCFITQKGLDVLDQLERPILKLQSNIEAHMSTAELSKLIDLLDEMRK